MLGGYLDFFLLLGPLPLFILFKKREKETQTKNCKAKAKALLKPKIL